MRRCADSSNFGQEQQGTVALHATRLTGGSDTSLNQHRLSLRISAAVNDYTMSHRNVSGQVQREVVAVDSALRPIAPHKGPVLHRGIGDGSFVEVVNLP